MDPLSIRERLDEVRNRIARAAVRARRDPADVRLIAVTKTQPVEAVRIAVEAGVMDIGENRVQEAIPKIEQIKGPTYHLIGHLQSNKAKLAVRHFHLIHSIDSESLAAAVDHAASAAGIRMPVLLQVNVAGEDTKSGMDPDNAGAVALNIAYSCPALDIQGFMTMAPLVEDPEETRIHFRRLSQLAETICREAAARGVVVGSELSMGMTNDFEVAVEEGATMVRIGSAIFGWRG